MKNILLKNSKIIELVYISAKKNFGGFKKACIFASAFAPKRVVLKTITKNCERKRENIEKYETRDSVCPPSVRGAQGGWMRESRLQREILTMKSLILAQDER